MADYPGSIFEQRELENIPGVTFDATKKTRYYAEDLQNLAAEIVAIETVLGTNPSGAYDTVLEWLTALSAGGGGMEKVSPDETPDGSRVAFTFHSLPVWCNVDGQTQDEGDGYAVAGTGPWTLTFDNAPQSILKGFANL